MDAQLTPKDVFDKIIEATGLIPKTICQLHKPCKMKLTCEIVQNTPMLDFDAVETEWHKGVTCSTSSADALTYTTHWLCIVELKGGKDFLKHQEIAQKEITTEKENDTLNYRIDKQVQKYKLQNKLLESIKICEEMTEMENIKEQLPVVFILVTDVDPQKNAVNVLAQQFNMLANTATDWETVYANRLEQHLQTEIKEIQTAFIYCKEFDHFIATLPN